MESPGSIPTEEASLAGREGARWLRRERQSGDGRSVAGRVPGAGRAPVCARGRAGVDSADVFLGAPVSTACCALTLPVAWAHEVRGRWGGVAGLAAALALARAGHHAVVLERDLVDPGSLDQQRRVNGRAAAPSRTRARHAGAATQPEWTTRSSPALDYRNLEMRKYDRRCPGALGPEHPEPRRGNRRGLPLAGSGALSCPIGRDPGTDVRFAGVIGQPALSGASLFGRLYQQSRRRQTACRDCRR